MKFKDFLTEATGELWGFYPYRGTKDLGENTVSIFRSEKEAVQYMAKYLIKKYAKDYVTSLPKEHQESLFEGFKKISTMKDVLSFFEFNIKFSQRIYYDQYPVVKLEINTDKITSLV